MFQNIFRPAGDYLDLILTGDFNNFFKAK